MSFGLSRLETLNLARRASPQKGRGPRAARGPGDGGVPWEEGGDKPDKQNQAERRVLRGLLERRRGGLKRSGEKSGRVRPRHPRHSGLYRGTKRTTIHPISVLWSSHIIGGQLALFRVPMFVSRPTRHLAFWREARTRPRTPRQPPSPPLSQLSG